MTVCTKRQGAERPDSSLKRGIRKTSDAVLFRLRLLAMQTKYFRMESACELHCTRELARKIKAKTPKISCFNFGSMRSKCQRRGHARLNCVNDHLEKQGELYLNANLAPSEARQRALASLTQMLLSSNEFMYV